jgi:RNA polymerase sigma-70 factor (ECF subfamily)
LNQLAPQYAEVLCLTYLEENSVDEVCLLLKKSKKQVYNLLARAKTALKPLLEKEGISYENE